jgi:hypothetical protein
MKKSFLLLVTMLIISSTGIAQEVKSSNNLEVYQDEDTGLFGYENINTEEIVVPAKYTWAKDFSGDLAAVYTDGELAESMLDGHIFCKDCKSGFINKSGVVVIPLTYSDVESFSEGLAVAGLPDKVGKRDKYGFIDKSGKIVLPFKYNYGTGSFSDGLAVVCIYDKSFDKSFRFGFIDKSGAIKIPLIYELGTHGFIDGLALVSKDEKYGFIDKSGIAIIPLIYDYAYEFKDEMASVSKGGKFGYINKSGVEIIPVIYDNMYSFEGDIVKVELKGETFYINRKGERVENN